MRRLHLTVLILLAASPLAAQDIAALPAGQEELDKAIEIKIAADSYRDLTQVIGLCQQALKKGLDADNANIAQKVLASTYLQRGMIVAQALFSGQQQADWQQMRRLALVDLEKALDFKSDIHDALVTVGRLESLPGGDRRKAVEALESAVKLTGGEAATQAEALLYLGAIHPDVNERHAALSRAAELLPDDPRFLRGRAEVNVAMGKAEEALADLDGALDLDPKHIPTLEARAALLALLRRFDDARAAYDRVIEADPENANQYVQRARVSLLEGDLAEAIKDADRALDIDSSHMAALLLKTQAMHQLGKTDEALASIERLLDEQPGLPAALRTRAVVYSTLERYAEAIDDLEVVAEQDPTDATVWMQLAMLYGATSYINKSIDAYSKAIDLQNDNWMALRGRADASLSLGKQRTAIEDYEAALVVEPDEPGVLNNLAWVLATSPDAALRDGRRAIELATKACELTEYKQAHILSTLAAGYAETGDFEKAIEWSKKAVAASEPDMRENLEKELASYERGEPWRETQNEPAEPEAKQTPAATAQRPISP